VNKREALIVAAALCSIAVLRSPSAAGQQIAAPAAAVATVNDNGCVQAAPLLSLSDYDRRFKKIAAFLTHKIELKIAQKPYAGKGPPLCRLDTREKFALFVRNVDEPLTFLAAGFNAGLAQAGNDDAAFGQGARGYGQRFGAALTDDVAGNFFGTFLYPSVFCEDPRYYRLLNGSAKRRLGHALTHVFVARADSGEHLVNYSEWFTAASSAALQNLYHPGNRRGFGPAATSAGVTVATDMGWDVLREFWPEITRTFKLPFLHKVGANKPARRSHGAGDEISPVPAPSH